VNRNRWYDYPLAIGMSVIVCFVLVFAVYTGNKALSCHRQRASYSLFSRTCTSHIGVPINSPSN
jgi:hypothetical protein